MLWSGSTVTGCDQAPPAGRCAKKIRWSASRPRHTTNSAPLDSSAAEGDDEVKAPGKAAGADQPAAVLVVEHRARSAVLRTKNTVGCPLSS